MSDVSTSTRTLNAKAASEAALEQMYGYYAFAWQPFAPARAPAAKKPA